MGYLCFLISALFFGLLLLVVYLSKQRIKSVENKLFFALTSFNLFGILNELVLQISISKLNFDTQYQIIVFISKLYLDYLFIWFSLLTVYTIIISSKKQNAEKENYFDKLTSIFIVISVIVIGVIFVLPISIYYENPVMYSYGAGPDFIKVAVIVNMAIWIGCIIRNFKNIKDKKYIPVIIIIVLLIGMSMIQIRYPEILLATVIGTFTCYLMFFTIENPDVKLISELNIAKEQAEQANNYKTEFLSSMSHEIRTPLNAIMGFSSALADEEIPESAKQEVKDIVMASNILLDIVNGILDISKIEANKLEIINNDYKTSKMLSDLISLTKARMGDKPLDFRTSFDPSIPAVLYGDQSRLKQIILNLLTNAVKYTKEGFVDFKISCFTKNDICRLLITVEDSGVGIKQEDIDKLFNKFERLNEGGTTSIEGTGLGLAITKKLVELMGGQIVVHSVFGQGSKFTVAINQRIVKVEESEETQLDDTQLIQSLDLSSKKILIVDDNRLNLKVAERLLSTFKLQITTVDSGFECLEKITNKEQYDLIFLDDMMPKMSGVETLKKLKENPEFNIPVIALTANAIVGMKEKYIAEGFNDYLAKPIEKNELYRVLYTYLFKNK